MTSIPYPVVGIVGQSGTGKTRCLKSLNPETTAIFNLEKKHLPWKDSAAFFPNMFFSDDLMEFEQALRKVLKNPKITDIVIDSFTKYCELVRDQSKKINKGYEIWNFYNDKITSLLSSLKDNDRKFVWLIAIDELVKFMKPSGAEFTQRRIAVQGKQWEGKVEKEFTVVLFSDVLDVKGKKSEYRFLTNSDGTISAKSPEDMLEDVVPNDINKVRQALIEYYNINTPSPTDSPENNK